MIVARVRRTIEEHGLLRRGDVVLLGLSGGADSVALLHALRALRAPLGFVLEAATVDHGLRASAHDEHQLVQRRCEALEVRCERVSLGLASGADLQERAREARYAALAEVARARGARSVAVAHTRDDQAETVLARLVRGTGVRGLSGALRRREDGVIRPLLDVAREQGLAYLRAVGDRAWVEDPSNADGRFLRSRIRHVMLPAISAEAPELAQTLARLADEARELRALVESLADATPLGETPSIEAIRGLAPPVRREALRRWAEREGARLGRAHLEALERLCLTARGEARLPGAVVVLIQDGRLRRAPLSTDGLASEGGGGVEEA